MTTNPLVDDSGALDTERLYREAVPIAQLVALVGLVALVPIAVQFFLFDGLGLRSFEGIWAVLSQFLLAVGSGVVLLYVVVRALEISDE